MSEKHYKWIILIGLSLVWGSSFILMKLALIGLTPIQVGALRMLISSLFLLVIAGHKIKHIERRHWKYLFYNAMSGTFFPVFLFSYAVLHIDSGIVAILNSLTPLSTLILGFLFFGFLFSKKQLLGIFLGFLATAYLISKSADLNPSQNYEFALLVVIATIGYALNVNILKKYLSDLDVMSIAVGNFLVVLIPSFIVLFATGFFSLNYLETPILPSVGYVSILAIVGTAISTIFFNKLVKVSSPIFASSVTYLIPIVALLWGIILLKEKIYFSQIIAGIIILLAVYMVNRNKK